MLHFNVMKGFIMKRNRIIYGLLAFILLFAISSCEDFLDKSPNGVLTSANFYRNEADATAAINAAYEILTDFWVKSIAFEKDIPSDDAVKGQGVDLGALTTLDNLNLNPADTPPTIYWQLYYRGIYRTNLVIKYVPDIEMDSETKDRIMGEAYFLRAFYYYNLVIRYGGVPLVTSPDSEDLYPVRASVEDTWKLIEDDLVVAADLLPAKSEYSAENKGRVSQGSAQTLLGIASLFQEKWQAAYDAFGSVISSGEYSLQPNFGDIFKPEADNGSEVVFETQFQGGGSYGNGFNFWVRPRNGSTIFGLGFCLPTQDLVDEFEESDPRLRYTVIRPGDIISDEVSSFPFEAAWAPETGYSCGKYVVDIPVGTNAERHEQNQKNIRYAEVLLGYAEAAFRLQKPDEAVDKINDVRERARGGNSSVLPDVEVSDDIFAAIVHERRVELALEGKRYFDLVRWGLADEELGPLGYKVARLGLYPVPQSEMDSNHNLVQNPGYTQ